ncbi:MAG: Asp-tRNA(Asn)/Glu-tRNA(Gln) amidotransferase subunit GatB [Patescibacteria group bacterium]|jgi:aspartyl-tRNA(Asn)/glutamyl-tRNA(Gln) amidotransferase subunit B
MSDKYEPIIGLEVHIQLNTKSKMFCGCDNNAEGKEPNTTVCPVCFGMPGTLPVMNRLAVEKTLLLGLALGGKISEKWNFERKNYFYPDLPKGYQITSSTNPPVIGGTAEVVDLENGTTFNVKINHLHLEEDAGKLVHKNDGYTYVDLNRAGTPLIELVTEPDIHSASDAKAFLQELQALARRTGVSDADMEKGHLRCDANISIKKVGADKLGTKVEVKNLNSFRMVERAIKYEIDRQASILTSNGKIEQETRGWDDARGVTTGQRSKEDVQDYRYMPEPDLPPIIAEKADELSASHLKKQLSELPSDLRARLSAEYGLTLDQAQTCVLDPGFCHYIEQVYSQFDQKELVSGATRILFGDVKRVASQNGLNFTDIVLSPKELSHIITLIINDTLGHNVFKNNLMDLLSGKVKVAEFLKTSVSTEAKDYTDIILSVLVHNSKAVEQYKNGDTKVLGFLVGQVMKEVGGSADPKLVNKQLVEHINASK